MEQSITTQQERSVEKRVPEYLLRWRFDYGSGVTKVGMWSHPGETDDLSTKAWCNNKEGLVYAIVEAKHYVERTTKVVLAVPGADFVNFQWIAVGVAPMSLRGLSGDFTPVTSIGGLKVITRNEELRVLDCGKITRHPVTTENINFATFGK